MKTAEQKLAEVKAKVDKGELPAHEYEKLKAKISKNRKKRNTRKSALKAVAQFVLDNSKDEKLIEQAKLISPAFRMVVSRSTSKDVVAELFQKQTQAHEDELWAGYKLGRAEMRKIRVNLIKKAEKPEDRMWIDFDPGTGVYTLVGVGPDAPEGWTGYIPVDVKDVEIE